MARRRENGASALSALGDFEETVREAVDELTTAGVSARDLEEAVHWLSLMVERLVHGAATAAPVPEAGYVEDESGRVHPSP